jgi:hypothetical protein
MTRWIGFALAFALVCSAWSQAAFTIRRPADGATVRETVSIRIPRASIPSGGYVGIFVNGRFMDAVVPIEGRTIQGPDFVYALDTKRRQIPEGRTTIEAVLYVPFEDAPRVMERSSVEVVVDNSTSIRPPTGAGFVLRYRFVPGQEWIYRIEIRQSVARTTEAQLQLGGIAAELPREGFAFRQLFAIDNAFSVNGQRQGLVRSQAIPDVGRDYIIVPTAVDPVPRRYWDHQLASVFYRLTDTGREVFGHIPVYVPLDGMTATRVSEVDLFALPNLPVLPTRPVQVGDRWQAPFLTNSFATVEEALNLQRLTRDNLATGTLEAVEFERGQRSARIRNSIKTGLLEVGAVQELDEVFWFSLDTGKVTRLVRTFTTTVRTQEAAVAQAGVPGREGRRPGRGGPPGGAQEGALGAEAITPPPPGAGAERLRQAVAAPGGVARPGGGTVPGGLRPGGLGRPGGAAPGRRGAQLNIVRVQMTMTLE